MVIGQGELKERLAGIHASPERFRWLLSGACPYVCIRCALRFCGVGSPTIHQAPTTSLLSVLEPVVTKQPDEAQSQQRGTCNLCLGALETSDAFIPLSAPIVERAKALVQQRGYELHVGGDDGVDGGAEGMMVVDAQDTDGGGSGAAEATASACGGNGHGAGSRGSESGAGGGGGGDGGDNGAGSSNETGGGVRRSLTMAFSLSLPPCIAIRDRACWESLRAAKKAAVGKDMYREVHEVKDILKGLLETPISAALGIPKASQSPDIKVTVTISHDAADEQDYESLVKPLAPQAGGGGGGGKAYHRTKKRRRNRGSNEDNLCTQSIVSTLLGTIDRSTTSSSTAAQSLVAWFTRRGAPDHDSVSGVNGHSSAGGECLVGEGMDGGGGGGGGGGGSLNGGSGNHTSARGRQMKAQVQPMEPLTAGPNVNVGVVRESVFLEGRYCKYSREMPQTAWVTPDGIKKGTASVEEVVAAPIIQWCGAQSYVFMGAGREDIDVRMLGSGRPFLLQLNDVRRAPYTRAHVHALQQAVNDASANVLNFATDVLISDLHLADKSRVKAMHEAATDKEKFYTCVVWVSRPVGPQDLRLLEDAKDLKVQQRTPIRVLHRRSLLTRPKEIFEMRVEPLTSHFFLLHLRASAGTYIKEFVHGDLGRTVPSVASLLQCDADILQLDVTDVVHKGQPHTVTSTPTHAHAHTQAPVRHTAKSEPAQTVCDALCTAPTDTHTAMAIRSGHTEGGGEAVGVLVSQNGTGATGQSGPRVSAGIGHDGGGGGGAGGVEQREGDTLGPQNEDRGFGSTMVSMGRVVEVLSPRVTEIIRTWKSSAPAKTPACQNSV